MEESQHFHVWMNRCTTGIADYTYYLDAARCLLEGMCPIRYRHSRPKEYFGISHRLITTYTLIAHRTTYEISPNTVVSIRTICDVECGLSLFFRGQSFQKPPKMCALFRSPKKRNTALAQDQVIKDQAGGLVRQAETDMDR